VTGEPRYKLLTSESELLCLDCGALVAERAAHTRFHSVLSGHAWALAVLKTSHIAAHVHDKYDVVERIDSKRFDSWTGDALAEVAGDPGPQDVKALPASVPGGQPEPPAPES
jgi:hypothetical protein